MDNISRILCTVIVTPFRAIPIGIAILLGWAKLDLVLGEIEVTQFLREHRRLVAQSLFNPKVHSFSLSHAPDHPATLLIRFDVDDKETYLGLEDRLDEHFGLRFPARWETNLRSKEDLGNNFGIAAQGIGEIMAFFHRIVFTFLAAAFIAGVSVFLTLRPFGTRPSGGGRGGKEGPACTDASSDLDLDVADSFNK